MVMKKPVIVSDCEPLKRIVGMMGNGLVYESDNPRSLSEMICRLYDNPEEARRMGNKGYEAVQVEFNWNASAKELIRLYLGLHGKVSQ